MKKEIIGIFVCMLLIATTLPVVGTMSDDKIYKEKSADYGHLVQKTRSRIMVDWLEQGKLTASDGAIGDWFGYSVSIDGDSAIIGAYQDEYGTGSAYVFKRTDTTWGEEQKLIALDGVFYASFGLSVSIDGDFAIIGAPTDDDNGEDSGSAYIFKRYGTDWMQERKLTAWDGETDDWFGVSVSIDGDYAIVGAYGDDSLKGSAYVFKYIGTRWAEEEKLTASDGAIEDLFGCSVSIDGDYAIVGAYGNDDNGEGSGSAYIFKRTGTSWTEEQKLIASDGGIYDSFGSSVSIDGDYSIIGAPGDEYATGSAYVFKRTGTVWDEEQKLTASDGAIEDWFGCSISINGAYTIVGAEGDDDNGEGSGSAYVFKRTGSTWLMDQKLTASYDEFYDVSDSFGCSVSIDGDYAIVGAYGDEYATGSAYVFWRDVPDNQPPEAPLINGPTSGKAGQSYSYTFVSVDPDNDDVFYEINWGDGNVNDWDGPHESNTIIIRNHTWEERGEYKIMARAKDVHEAIGEWGTLEVTMPKNKAFNINLLFLRFLEQHPHMFPILRHMLGL